MPAGVSWGQYMKFLSAAMLSMMAGSQLVHMYYKPLEDLSTYIEREMETTGKQQGRTNSAVVKVELGNSSDSGRKEQLKAADS